MAMLMDDGIDPLKEDIRELVDRIENQSDASRGGRSDEVAKILDEMGEVKGITDRQLLSWIENEGDFRIADLKEIMETDIQLKTPTDQRIIAKAITISNIFNTLGDLDSNTIAFASRKYTNITLDNLYSSEAYIDANGGDAIQPIDVIEESLIRQEYLNAKASTRFSLIAMSIEDGIELDKLPLEDLNRYIDGRNKYREAYELAREIKSLNGREDSIIPGAMKGGVQMSLGELVKIDSILNRGYGIGNILDDILRGRDGSGLEGMEAEIEALRVGIKDLSTSLRGNGKDIAGNYKRVLEGLGDLNHSLDFNMGERDEGARNIQEYLRLQNELSRDDFILQIPIATDTGYSNINLIINGIGRGIDQDDMVFHFNLKTDNLGQVRFNLEVVGDEISVCFKSDREDAILENKQLLEEGLREIGYNLKTMDANDTI